MDAKWLESRPSSLPPLAAIGVEEHHWNRRWKSLAEVQEEMSRIKAEGEISSSTYTEVQNQMQPATSTLALGNKPKSRPEKKQRTKEDMQLVEERKQTQNALTRMSQLVGKISNIVRLNRVKMLTDKLRAKQYCNELATSVNAECTTMRDKAKELHDSWSQWTIDVKSGRSIDLDKVEAAMTECDDAYKGLEDGVLAMARQFTK